LAYFGVPDDRKFHIAASTLKPWPANSEGYRLYVSGSALPERIGIEVGNIVELQLTGAKNSKVETALLTDARTSGKQPTAYNEPASVLPTSTTFAPQIATSNKHKFEIVARKPGTTTLTAVDSKGAVLASLTVLVGTSAKHMKTDLVADICGGDNALKIHALQRMLNNRQLATGGFTNNDNIFEQLTAANFSSNPAIGKLSCGIVAKWRGEEVFGKISAVKDDWYRRPLHEPLSGPVTDRRQVKYKPKKLKDLAGKIAAALETKGEAVRVGVLDSPIGMKVTSDGKLVAYEIGGHTVLVVGCNAAATEFLYIDPWGGGSMMEYKGGIPGMQLPGKCTQMGILTFIHDRDRRLDPTDSSPNLIRGSTLTEGSFSDANRNFLEVVSAPF
jgi:hypothetical protein